MAFVYRSPKQSYFDQTAISYLKNDVTNLSSFIGQDQSEIYNQDCIREASTNQPNIKNHFKGLTFIPNASNEKIEYLNVVVGHSEDDRVVSVYQLSKDSPQISKIHKFPHTCNSKDLSLQKNKIAEQVKQFLESQRLRKIQQNNRSYSKNKVVRKSKQKQIFKDSAAQMKYFKNQKIQESTKRCVDYQSCNLQKGKMPKLLNRNIRKVLAQQKQVGTIPSIPSKKNQFGYVLCDPDHSLSLPKLVSQMKYTGDKQNMPGPCDYDYKINKKVKGVLKIDKTNKSVPVKKQKQELLYCLRSQESTVPVKEKKLKRIPRTQIEINQIMKTQQIHRDQSDSECESEYEQNTTPGPGQYNLEKSYKKQFRSKKQDLQKIFYNKQPRFLKNQVSYQEITVVNQGEGVNHKLKDQSFLTKVERKFIYSNNRCESPSPGHYDDRNSLEYKVVSKIMKSSNSKAFISNEKRFHKRSNPFMPGPGQYNHENKQKQEQEKDRPSSSFKSTLERDIFKIQKEKSIFKPTKESIIHNIKDCILQQQPQKPGFSSSSPRFKQNKISEDNHQTHRNFDERVVKPSPKKYPFNSSSVKRDLSPVSQGVAVGSYETFDENNWHKKSYNILYN